MIKIELKEVTDLDVQLGNAEGMPPYQDLYKTYDVTHPTVLFAESIFYGMTSLREVKEKEGVDRRLAVRHLAAWMKDWGPKQEHKMAACAALLEQYFEVPKKS